MSNKEIITNIPNKEEFFKLLQNNPGLILLKFGATWCGPCQKPMAHNQKMLEEFGDQW